MGQKENPTLGDHRLNGFILPIEEHRHHPRAPNTFSVSVVLGVFRRLSTFLEGIWSPREYLLGGSTLKKVLDPH